MPLSDIGLSTGILSLDKMLQGLAHGDNIVWQIASAEDYIPFVVPFCEGAVHSGRQVTYFRFARHQPLIDDRDGISTVHLDTASGFEAFIGEIHAVVESSGRDAVYVFDCLSDLAVDWSSDRMLGNFFLLVCPYIRDHGGMAYFGLTRNAHSFHALDPVRNTTQILINACRFEGEIYVQPLKVEHRHSRTMYMLHVLRNGELQPVTQSSTVARVHGAEYEGQLSSSNWHLGYWSSTFAEAESLQMAIEKGEASADAAVEMVQKLRRMLIARDGRLLELAEEYLGLEELLAIRRRMIGTGLIGGKSSGMVIAQAILRKQAPDFAGAMEPHDSFFIGADVFYTYLVQNGLWWIKHQQKNPKIFLEGLELARHRILSGHFPDYIIRQFADVLEYYGQSPIIVRSSSLLEDDFDNSFAGKSESVLCANQGSFDKRLSDFVSAVQEVYASSMSKVSLHYRAVRGVLHKDEQMSILVQRVSGTSHGSRFFPHLAGVGLSFNPYAWDDRVDPQAGVLRLVFGLGTRAVSPHPEDHTRVVALNEPGLKIQYDDDTPQTQQKVDVLDLETGRICVENFETVVTEADDLPVDVFASPDGRLLRLMREQQRHDIFPWALTFDSLLAESSFVSRMQQVLATLEKAYGTPVDIEFAANFTDPNTFEINLLQCRPLHAQGLAPGDSMKMELGDAAEIMLESSGPVLGQSRIVSVDRVIYVETEVYGLLPIRDRYAVARLIGDLMRLEGDRNPTIMLIGPGRWGTADPSLGVPVSFAELHGATIICEVAAMHKGLSPDVSLGSHFFNELVETNILYFALYPDSDKSSLKSDFFSEMPNRLPDLVPGKEKWAHVVKVVEPHVLDDGGELRFFADTMKQSVLLVREPTAPSHPNVADNSPEASQTPCTDTV